MGSFSASFSFIFLMVATIAEAAFLRDVSGEIVVFRGRAVLETLRRVLKWGIKNGPNKNMQRSVCFGFKAASWAILGPVLGTKKAREI